MYNAVLDNRGFCCGVYEIGRFDGYADEDNDEVEVGGSTPARFLESIKDAADHGAVLTIWFAKRGENAYYWDAIRDAVRAIPGVINIATTVNPNSGNTIDGYAWVNNK